MTSLRTSILSISTLDHCFSDPPNLPKIKENILPSFVSKISRWVWDRNDGVEVAIDAFTKYQSHVRLLSLHRFPHISSTVKVAQSSSDNSNFLHPPGPPSPLASSPSDIVDPSPIAPSSNGTDFEDTVIEQEEVEHLEPLREEPREDLDSTPSLRQGESGLKILTQSQLDTTSAPKNNLRPSSDEDEQPNSVIHAPQSFEAFVRF
ncbi:MAG: hypothetical protein Q9214_002564 [Letrouitia sp. 1 TL-2023]